MPKSIFINHVMLQGAPNMLSEAKQRLAGDPATSPLGSFGCSATMDGPGVLWLSFATGHALTVRDTEALVACAPGVNLKHVLIDPVLGWAERRYLDRHWAVQATELLPDESEIWLRAT